MKEEIGIITGCDQNQEWLLSWWHSHLRKHHPDIPIAFGDLGMSFEGREWCKKHGTLIPASEIGKIPDVTEEGFPLFGEKWRQKLKKLPDPDAKWWLKPSLMQKSPFAKSLWLDLDLQILSSLDKLISLPLGKAKMAFRTSGAMFITEMMGKGLCLNVKCGNSGVVLFEKGSFFLDLWAASVPIGKSFFYNDDCLSSFLVQACEIPITPIPFKYNWEYRWGENKEAVICHFVTEGAKHMLRLSFDFPFGEHVVGNKG